MTRPRFDSGCLLALLLVALPCTVAVAQDDAPAAGPPPCPAQHRCETGRMVITMPEAAAFGDTQQSIESATTQAKSAIQSFALRFMVAVLKHGQRCGVTPTAPEAMRQEVSQMALIGTMGRRRDADWIETHGDRTLAGAQVSLPYDDLAETAARLVLYKGLAQQERPELADCLTGLVAAFDEGGWP